MMLSLLMIMMVMVRSTSLLCMQTGMHACIICTCKDLHRVSRTGKSPLRPAHSNPDRLTKDHFTPFSGRLSEAPTP